jgi:hypothetical protein
MLGMLPGITTQMPLRMCHHVPTASKYACCMEFSTPQLQVAQHTSIAASLCWDQQQDI